MYVGVVLPTKSHHVTLTFNGHDESKQSYQNAVAATTEVARGWTKPIELTFKDKLSVFDPPGVWVSEVDSNEELIEFRQLLTFYMNYNGVYWSDEFDYRPHVTLTYFKKPKVNPYLGLTFPVTHVTVVSNEFGNTEVLI
jgi:2'-5' RNA ligase